MAQPLMGLPLQSFKQSGSFPGAGGNDLSSQLFSQFCNASAFQGIMDAFQQMCHVIGLHPVDHQIFYKQLKTRLLSWKAQSLWSKLDKRSANSEYKKGTACNKTRALVIGGGPCGLRVATEIALLGGKVVVVEKNEEFSRNNVLHLWPFLIHDLKALGAKTFCGKFCTGAIDHISIRALQCILLKVALLLGVEVHSGVTFEEFSEPPSDQTKDKIGWRAKVTPEEHPVSEFVFDVCISADGKRNTMTEFKRKEFRGKLAIAITANFINCGTKAETSIEENSRVASIFNQKFFKDLNRHAGIDLENIVYYKDETHYFVMTAKKHSLLCKGVLLQDYDDSERLLSKKNVNQQALLDYARQAANMSTQHQLANLEFAHNHYGQPDVAMFDLTSMFVAEHACRIVERQGYRLLVALVGDTLLEPFWTTGSGCARGFLGAFDAAWMIRSWSSGKMTPLEVIAERESIYQLLSQTTPENLNKNYLQYTIDPNTRYLNLRTQIYNPHQVASQYDGHEKEYLNEVVKQAAQSSNCHGKEATMRRTSERVTYVTEGEIEESECEQTKHNLSHILRPSTFSDDSSSDEELHFSGEEASDEQPDLFWAELARRYSEQLSRTKLPTLSQKRTSSANSGSESETFEEASDTDFETDYNTDKENASEESDPFFGACKGFGMRQHGCRDEFSNPLLNLSLKQNICLETKPLPTSVEIMRNRMAFFDAISQPVRIDASVFLGLVPPPPAEKTTCHDEKSIIESEKDDEKDEQNVNAEMIKESDDILKHHGPEDGIDARRKKRHAEKTAVIKKAKKRTKRRKKEETGHVTANVETIKLLTMQEAVSVVAISSATSSDEHCDLEIPFASELPDASKKSAVSGVTESCSEVDAAREESDKRYEKQSIWRDQPFAKDGGCRSKFASENSQALQYSDSAEIGLSPYQGIACEEALTEDKKCLALESAALESDDSAEQIGRMSDIQDHTDRQDLNLSTEQSEPFEELEITKKNVLQNYNHHKTVDENLEFGYVVFEKECLIHSEGEKFNPYEKLICNGSCKEYSEIQSAVTDEKENDHLDGIVSHDGSEFDHDKQNSSMMAAKEEEAVQTWDESAENLEHFEYKQTLPIKTSKNCDNLDVQVSTCAVLRHQLRLNGIKVATEENTSAMNEIIGDPKNVENTRLPLNSMKVIDETGVQTRAYGALSIECPDRVTYSVTDNALTEDNYAEKLVKQLPSECDRQTDVNNLDSNLSISNHKEQKTLDPLSRINLLLESLSVKNVGIRNESEKNEIGQTHAFILQNSPFEGEDSKKSISNSQTTVENGIIDENSHCKSSHEIYKEMKSLRMTAQKFQKPCRNGLSSDSSNYTASVSSESVGIHHEPSHSMEHLPSPTDERLSDGHLVNSLRFDDGSAVDMLAASNFREDLLSFQNIVGMNIDKIATLTHVQDSIQPKVVVGNYRQQGQSPPGVSRKTIGNSGSTASALSPNRIRDDKRKFFFEPPQPVRIAPCQIFKNIPFFKQFALAKEATGAVSVTSRESDSVFLQKETSNHGCGHTGLRAESKKGIESESHVESFIESQTTSALSVVHGEALKKHKKVLPTVPSTQPPLQDLTTSDSRTAIASAALLLVSSSMLGKFNMQEQYAKMKNPVLKEDKISTSAFTVMEEKPKGGGESAFDVSEPTVARPCLLWSELKSESLMLRSEIRHAQQSQVSQSDVASTEEISPSLPQKDSRFKYLHHLKSRSKDSDATVRKTDKKDKGKSLLAILMPSRNFDKKEKSKSQYEPISKHTDPVSMAVVREKTKSLPLEKKQHPSMMAQESKHLSSEKSKGKLKSKTGMIADKPTEAGHSIYKEIAGIMEGIKKTEKRNQDKINIRDRIEAVAPPPAKSSHAVLLPPMADSEDFETESELEDDRLSLHRFQSQMHLLSEEEVAKVKRMQQKSAHRKQHEKELKRFHESQEIQQQLEDVEMRQREIERLGVEIEKTLSREGNDKHCDEVSLVQQWFDIAYEHSVLLQHESELMVQARELELEDRQSQLEIQLRERIPLTESHKAESLAEEEQKILQELIEVVEQRNALVLLLEEDRVRQQQYSKNLERIMSKRGFQLSPISHMHLPQSLSSLQEHR